MSWAVWRLNAGGVEIFCVCLGWSQGIPSLLYSGYWVFPGGKAVGAWFWPLSHSPSKHQGGKWVGAIPLPSLCACNVMSWGDLYLSVGSIPCTHKRQLCLEIINIL